MFDKEVERVRGEKVPANPIPVEYFSRFKNKLEEVSKKYYERNLMIFYIGVWTGYRLQDIVDLTIGDLKDAIEDQFLIQEKKQYKSWLSNIQSSSTYRMKKPPKREHELTVKQKEYIKKYIKSKRKSDYAFPSKKGGHISQRAYSKILATVGEELDLENISGHSLRKTYAFKVYKESGNDLEYTRKALGHKSVETTKAYLGNYSTIKKDIAKMTEDFF